MRRSEGNAEGPAVLQKTSVDQYVLLTRHCTISNRSRELEKPCLLLAQWHGHIYGAQRIEAPEVLATHVT